jgi:hypothetical protein
MEDIRFPSYALGANCLEDVFLLLFACMGGMVARLVAQ